MNGWPGLSEATAIAWARRYPRSASAKLPVRSQTNAEVVQRDREIRMTRTECGFLYGGGFTQQALGCEIVAIGGGLLRSLDHGCGIESIAHGSGHSTRK